MNAKGLQDLLKRLKSLEREPNITITTNASRSYSDAAIAKEHLKRLGLEAEVLLHQHYEKRTATEVAERLWATINGVRPVDHRLGMVLFVNPRYAEVIHLPFTLPQRVSVGPAFHVRDLLRAGLGSLTYHVLVLSSAEARLFEANDDQLVREVRGDFPLENRHYTTDVTDLTMGKRLGDLARRYHMEVDDAVRNVTGPKGLVIIASTADMYSHYLKAAVDPKLYLGNLKGSLEPMRIRGAIHRIWKMVHEGQKTMHLAELARSTDAPRGLSTAVDDIWRFVREGRGHILFVERDKQQAALMENSRPVLLDEHVDHVPAGDLVDEIINTQIEHGGEVRILPNGSMEHYNGIALKLRY